MDIVCFVLICFFWGLNLVILFWYSSIVLVDCFVLILNWFLFEINDSNRNVFVVRIVVEIMIFKRFKLEWCEVKCLIKIYFCLMIFLMSLRILVVRLMI